MSTCTSQDPFIYSKSFLTHFLKKCLLANKRNVICNEVILMILKVSNLLRIDQIKAATISRSIN